MTIRPRGRTGRALIGRTFSSGAWRLSLWDVHEMADYGNVSRYTGRKQSVIVLGAVDTGGVHLDLP